MRNQRRSNKKFEGAYKKIEGAYKILSWSIIGIILTLIYLVISQ